MTAHRNAERITLKTQDHAALQLCLTDTSMRVMVFCAAGNTGPQDIAFPYQCELKVNGGEIKANLRGVKNKPGSTRPVDITDSLRLKPTSYSNNVELTYALTQKVSSAPLNVKAPTEVWIGRGLLGISANYLAEVLPDCDRLQDGPGRDPRVSNTEEDS
jgi:E3 SUMO-protein ligase PIAS1